MPIDPKWMKMILVFVLIVAGVFVGYQLVSDSDVVEFEADTESQMIPPNPDADYEYIEGESVQIESEADLEVSMDETIGLEALGGDQYGNKIQFSNTFEHTKPGEYSEIVVEASGLEPGEFTIMYIWNADTQEWIEAGGQEHNADSNGRIKTRFTITRYGNYEVRFHSGGEEIVSPVITVN